MTEPLPAETIAELERLEREATPGEWCPTEQDGAIASFHPTGERATIPVGDIDIGSANEEFMIRLRNAAPALLAAARREREQTERIRDLEKVLLKWLQYARAESNRKGEVLPRAVVEQIAALEAARSEAEGGGR